MLDLRESLDWLARVGGLMVLPAGLLGFFFREKWKQMLRRSLARDVEIFKSELAKSQAEHAASLTPQLEQIKHDFQQKIESYKVSLIAEAEAAKAKSELKKSIAVRYAEIEFERLVHLEEILAPIWYEVIALASISTEQKTMQHASDVLQKLQTFGTAIDKAEMFMSDDDRLELLNFRSALLALVGKYIGPLKPTMTLDAPDRQQSMHMAIQTHTNLKTRIRAVGAL